MRSAPTRCYADFVDDAASRAARRRAEWTGGVARSFQDMDAIDLAFWQRMTPEQRVRAMWSLVEDSLALEGRVGPPPRLQKSVGGVRPRRG
jgi:hypothetical protein